MINASDEVWERYINPFSRWIELLGKQPLMELLEDMEHCDYLCPDRVNSSLHPGSTVSSRLLQDSQRIKGLYLCFFFFQDDIYFIVICTLNHVSWSLLIQESAQNKSMLLMRTRYFAINSVLYVLKIQLCNNTPLVHRDTVCKLLWVCTWKAVLMLRNFNKLDKTSGNTLYLRET